MRIVFVLFLMIFCPTYSHARCLAETYINYDQKLIDKAIFIGLIKIVSTHEVDKKKDNFYQNFYLPKTKYPNTVKINQVNPIIAYKGYLPKEVAVYSFHNEVHIPSFGEVGHTYERAIIEEDGFYYYLNSCEHPLSEDALRSLKTEKI